MYIVCKATLYYNLLVMEVKSKIDLSLLDFKITITPSLLFLIDGFF